MFSWHTPILGARFIQREIIRSEMSNPSISSSPWMRGASSGVFRNHAEDQLPQLLRRRPSTNRSRTREISLQYMRKPALCHRTTVSGVTMMTACFHRDHSRLMPTQKNLSNRLRAGRGRGRFSTISC
jgi:hypothetical protein